MSTTTETDVNLDRYQRITTPDGLTVEGTQRIGFHVINRAGVELAHMTQTLDAWTALCRFRSAAGRSQATGRNGMNNAVSTYNAAARIEMANGKGQGVALTREDMEVLRATVLKGASDAQLTMYGRSCAKLDLDPFSKEVYGFVNREGGIELVVSIDGLRKQAEKSGEYRGQTQQQWCGPDGEWTDVWLAQAKPAAAHITVHRLGHEPFTGVALWSEYGKPNQSNWTKFPTVMLSKCAEASAIRHLFPHQTGSLYISEEMPERGSPGVEAVVVDRSTGEIAAQPLNLDDDIKRLRGLLGWSAQDVIEEAKRADPPINLRRSDGKQGMVDRLQSYVDVVESEGEDGEEEQGVLIDAESRVAGEAEADRYTS